MALVSGTRLGPYEILAPLGAGGMGEVYRARDTKLNREVALKVLPAAMANDAERMARFQREAQVLASLNHPNIAAIYGLEDSGGVHALVMELVEGPTLAERLSGTQPLTRPLTRPASGGPPSPLGRGAGGEGSHSSCIPVDEALPIAKQIAEALEYAHEKGIIHRDLKPSNIKTTAEGTVKVLDFGLAKALDVEASISSSISNSPTLTAAATQAGMILGTAAYMSPEQARGKTVDRRADVWAFGGVLFEMLSGRRAFEGESTTDTLAAVIKSEPDWDELPRDIPASIRRLIERCLTKDPKRRLQAIGEARIAIEDYLANPVAGKPAAAPTSPVALTDAQPRPGKGLAAVLLSAGLTLIVGLAIGWWSRRSESNPTWSGQMLGGPNLAFGPRISPDGRTLAFQAMVDGLTQVAVMDTESGDWTVLTKSRSRGYVTELNWSTDGTEIYFDREYSAPRGIYSVSRFGGDERLILEDAMGPEVLPDGSLLVVRVNENRDFQLNRFWPESGRLSPLNAIISSSDLCPPVRAFRDGKEAVFVGKTLDQAKTDPVSHLYVIDLTSGKARRLAPQLEVAPSAISFFPLAVPIGDQSVLIDSREGDLHRIVEVPRSGSAPVRTLLSLTAPPLFMDVGKDGSIFLDQTVRPSEVLRFPAQGGTPEILAGAETPYSGAYSTFQIADGRILINSTVAGRSRLLLAKPGGDVAPFIATKEATSVPACPVGQGDIAFLLGPEDNAVVAVASIADGRIIRRLQGVQGSEVRCLVASRDGTTLYYVASRTVWAIPTSDGQPRPIGPGDDVTADPNGKDLIVSLYEKEGVRLVRVPVSGGAEEPIPLQSALRLAPVIMGPDGIGKDGRALVSIATPDNWFYGAGVLDLRSGKLDRIPLNFTGDVLGLGWQSDGRILSTGWPLKAKLWRFRPVQQEQK